VLVCSNANAEPCLAHGLAEMIFHRLENDLIAESWRMKFPDGVYDLLAGP
jgi:hypothetical protein